MLCCLGSYIGVPNSSGREGGGYGERFSTRGGGGAHKKYLPKIYQKMPLRYKKHIIGVFLG